MIEPNRQDARPSSEPDTDAPAETVIALGRLIYRFCQRSPDLLACDPATLWRWVFDACRDDEKDKHVLVRFKDSSTWAMAVMTARLVHEVYAAGGLDEEPA